MSVEIHRRLYDAYADGGASTVLTRFMEWFFAEPRIWPEFHWVLSSRYYRRRCADDVRAYRHPPELFKLAWVDPSAIERHTRRQYPPWRERLRHFGSVLDGDWDRRERPPTDPTYGGPPSDLFIADRFEESVLYRSLEAHFDRHVSWEETQMFAATRRLLAQGGYDHVWHGCRSLSDVHERFRYLDQLYDSIRRSGFKSQRELIEDDPKKGFRHWLRKEITVDVGRDGELLLVSGKHRTAIAKLLDIDRIPVLFLVRHSEWMAHREAAIESDSVTNGGGEIHPDLQDLDE